MQFRKLRMLNWKMMATTGHFQFFSKQATVLNLKSPREVGKTHSLRWSYFLPLIQQFSIPSFLH